MGNRGETRAALAAGTVILFTSVHVNRINPAHQRICVTILDRIVLIQNEGVLSHALIMNSLVFSA